jgi:hypothetical protein
MAGVMVRIQVPITRSGNAAVLAFMDGDSGVTDLPCQHFGVGMAQTSPGCGALSLVNLTGRCKSQSADGVRFLALAKNPLTPKPTCVWNLFEVGGPW